MWCCIVITHVNPSKNAGVDGSNASWPGSIWSSMPKRKGRLGSWSRSMASPCIRCLQWMFPRCWWRCLRLRIWHATGWRRSGLYARPDCFLHQKSLSGLDQSPKDCCCQFRNTKLRPANRPFSYAQQLRDASRWPGGPPGCWSWWWPNILWRGSQLGPLNGSGAIALTTWGQLSCSPRITSLSTLGSRRRLDGSLTWVGQWGMWWWVVVWWV